MSTLVKLFFVIGEKSVEYEGRVLGLVGDIELQGLIKEKGLANKLKTSESVGVEVLSKLSNKDFAKKPGGLENKRIVFSLRGKKKSNGEYEGIFNRILVSSKIKHMDNYSSHTKKRIITISFKNKIKKTSWVVIEEER